MICKRFFNTAIGKIVIEANDRAVIRLSFPKEIKSVEFSESDFAAENKTEHWILNQAAGELLEYLAGKRRQFDVPLSPKGTRFQEKVWAELCKIPYGEVSTYGELAERIGNPKAARAVGMALNRNPIMIMIPCHRIIGKDGSLTGFGGGMAAKKYLLSLEKSDKFLKK